MPNTFANVILYIWPAMAFFIAKKMGTNRAAVFLIIIPYLFFPVGVGIPGIVVPSITKEALASITTLIVLSVQYRHKHYNQRVVYLAPLIVMLLSSPVFTWLTNTDVLNYGFGATIKPGLTIGFVVQSLFYMLTFHYMPFLVGCRYLNTDRAHFEFIKIIILFGGIYSLLAIWEVRMSPQLHSQLYGFFPHDFRQQIREGGYRPVVFLGHGLYVSVFLSIVYIASLTYLKGKRIAFNKSDLFFRMAVFLPPFFFFVLILCKTWSALIYAFIATLVLLVLNKKLVFKAASIIALFVFLYPVTRGLDLVPTTTIVTKIAEINYDRASSLRVRFENEEILLEKGNERPLFGWGGSGRSRVKDEFTGEDISITDGTWVILFGVYGWFGYAAIFGLLTVPILFLAFKVNHALAGAPTIYTAGLALTLSLNMLDLIPNSSISPLTFLLAGALMGRYASGDNSATKA